MTVRLLIACTALPCVGPFISSTLIIIMCNICSVRQQNTHPYIADDGEVFYSNCNNMRGKFVSSAVKNHWLQYYGRTFFFGLFNRLCGCGNVAHFWMHYTMYWECWLSNAFCNWVKWFWQQYKLIFYFNFPF